MYVENRRERRRQISQGPIPSVTISFWNRVRLSAVAVLSGLSLIASTCTTPNFAGNPTPGDSEFQQIGFLELQEGVTANAIGGNLQIRRELISVDNDILIEFHIEATYNSSTEARTPGHMGIGKWILNFQMHFETVAGRKYFVDDTGARLEITSHTHAMPIHGTKWDYWKTDGLDGVRSKTGLVHLFDAGGRLKRINGPVGSYIQFSKVPGTTLVGTIWACSVTGLLCDLIYTIDYEGKEPVTVSDDHGRTVALHWESKNLTAITSPGSLVTSFEYEEDLVSALVTPEGVRTEFAHSGDRIETVRHVSNDMASPVNTFFYAGAGPDLYATEWTDALGVKLRFVHDGYGRLRRIESGDAGRVFASWQWQGTRPTSRTDEAGLTWFTTWSNDSVVRVVTPSGDVVGYENAPAAFNTPIDLDGRPIGNEGPRALLRSWDSLCPNGNCLGENSYDGFGRLETSTNGVGETTWFVYHGQTLKLAGILRPAGEFSRLDHYVAGHPQRQIHGNPLYQPPVKVVSPIGDVEVGTSFYAPKVGGRASQRFDQDRRIVSITLNETLDPDADCEIKSPRRSDGRHTQVNRSACGGRNHLDSFNDLGWLVSRQEGEGDEGQEVWNPGWTFRYDVKGRIIKETDPDGRFRRFSFNEDGDLRSLSVWAGKKVSPWPEARDRWVYVDGQKTEYWTKEGSNPEALSQVYSYYTQGEPGAGQVERIDFADGTALELFYDLRVRLTKKRFLNADQSILRELNYEYDLANRLIGEFDGNALLVRRTFEDGHLEKRETGDGLTRTLYYGPAGELRSTETENAQGEIVEWSDFSVVKINPADFFDDEINVSSVTATLWNGSTWRSIGEDTTIKNGRVVSSWVFSEEGVLSLDFTFNFLSDLVSEGGSSYFDVESGRLVAAETIDGEMYSFSYNDTGQVMSRNGKSIGWTSGGCMSSHGADTFEWNASCSSLLSKTVDGVTTNYLYGGEMEEAAGQRSIRTRHYVVDVENSQHLYLHADNRGNTSFVTNSAGEVVNQYGYSPYRREVVYGVDAAEVTFVGRAEVGELMILGSRIYDPAVGRFISQDPRFQLINQYTYTDGNPIHFQDRDGMEFTTGEILAMEGSAMVAAGTVITQVVAGGVVVLAAGSALLVAGSLIIIGGIAILIVEELESDLPNPNDPGERARDSRRGGPRGPRDGGGEGRGDEGSSAAGFPSISFPSFDFGSFNFNINFASNTRDPRLRGAKEFSHGFIV